MTTQTFEEAVAEFLSRSKEQIDQESDENLPPWMPAPYGQDGPPYEYSQRFTSDFITRYALSIGDNNPIFTDPEYGKTTRYGCQIAPGPAMALVRYPSVHGAVRPGGYPLANFISGAAWEFFDAVREGTKFRSSKVTKEIFEKPGSRGNLVFFISDNHYWDFHGDLLGKCYGTQIYVPMSSMGSSRSMPVERLGEQMLYERKTSQYSNEQIEDVLTEIKNEPRRGAETRYWEDVEEGDTVGPVTLSPWTLQDQVCYHSLSYATVSGPLAGGDELSFEPMYKRARKNEVGHVHPITRWRGPGNEHEDALTAVYRGQPGPFDFGVQRTQMCEQLFSNWMGDDGFIRRLVIALRKPVYYGDVTTYTGEIVKKFKDVQEGESGQGAVPGKTEYHAVGIKYQGLNQVGEAQVIGTGTVYLPSREAGPVQLPVPHAQRPAFVPYETFYRDWY